MSTFENNSIYSFKKDTFSLLKYFWICIKLMTLIRILSVGFNGNNTINYFTNNGFLVLKQKLAIATFSYFPQAQHGSYITWVIPNITCFSFDSEIQHGFYDQFFLMLKFKKSYLKPHVG